MPNAASAASIQSLAEVSFGASIQLQHKRRQRLPPCWLANGLRSTVHLMHLCYPSTSTIAITSEGLGALVRSLASTPGRSQDKATAGDVTMFATTPRSTTSL